MDVAALARWGQLKGITLMGTGDFTHPIWRQELYQQLQPLDNGLFQLQQSRQAIVDADVYDSCRAVQQFLLTAEISTIFRRSGRVYKTHTLLFAPSFPIAEKIATKLSTYGNITYDGRPTLRLDVKDLLSLILDISPDCMVIPAHIWTPHFGLLGSKSGFDSFEACFGDMIDYIYAYEKGLSSNFVSNARISSLDRFAILSNSDAHSLQNLGREANVFDTELSYHAIMHALRANDPGQLIAGIEFFPELGKYFATGHRACHTMFRPEHVPADLRCPVCSKPMIMGVSQRVEQLADRTIEQAQKVMRQRYRIAPLQDIIADTLQVAATSKKVQQIYHQLLAGVGNEFYILLDAHRTDIAKYGSEAIACSIEAMRVGNVQVTAGYDGVFGSLHFTK